jgi:hypothetical protein
MTHYCIVSLLFFMLTTRGIFQSNFCNEKFLDKTPSQPIAGYSGTSLSSQLQRRLRSGGSWFQASPGKKKFYKISSQGKKLGVVAQACHPSASRAWKIGFWSRLPWAKIETLPE